MFSEYVICILRYIFAKSNRNLPCSLKVNQVKDCIIPITRISDIIASVISLSIISLTLVFLQKSCFRKYY